MVYYDVHWKTWKEYLKIKDRDMPETLILEGHLAYPQILSTRGKIIEDSREAWMPNLMIGKYKGKTVAYGITFGGPIASQFAHIYSKLGAKRIILIGECGGLQENIDLGEVVISDKVLSKDGVWKLYKRRSSMLTFNRKLTNRIADLVEETGMKYHRGKTVSYYDILLEEFEEVDRLTAQGYLGVDMEAASVASVANHFKVPAAALFMVGDNHTSGNQLPACIVVNAHFTPSQVNPRST